MSDQMKNNNDIIDIRELITSVWKRKNFIIIFTLIVSICTALISAFVISPVYNMKLNIVINIPEKYTNEYGECTLPLSTNQQYLNLITSNTVLSNTIKDLNYDPNKVTIDDLKNKIIIGNIVSTDNKQNNFSVTVKGKKPEDTLKFGKILYDNYIEFLDTFTKKSVLDYYDNYFKAQIKSLRNELSSKNEVLKNYEDILGITSKTIDHNEVLDEISSRKDISNFIVMEDVVNPNYTKIESDIINLKQEIVKDSSDIEVYTQYLEDIDKELSYVNEYYVTGEAKEYKDGIGSIINTYVSLPSKPVAPTRKSSPSIMKNTVVAAMLSGILGILVVLLSIFWYKKD